jgi:hypothetical protein
VALREEKGGGGGEGEGGGGGVVKFAYLLFPLLK